MQRFILALKLFWRILRDDALARRATPLLEGGAAVEAAKTPAAAAVSAPPAKPASTRSDALTLLAVLQREARLIDFLKENIAGYEDAQIGAAVRDVHRDAAAALDRLFALRALMDQAEGSEVSLAGGIDSNRLRLVGNVGAQSPAGGRLQHGGWQATKQDLPQYSGPASAAMVIAPAEVEI